MLLALLALPIALLALGFYAWLERLAVTEAEDAEGDAQALRHVRQRLLAARLGQLAAAGSFAFAWATAIAWPYTWIRAEGFSRLVAGGALLALPEALLLASAWWIGGTLADRHQEPSAGLARFAAAVAAPFNALARIWLALTAHKADDVEAETLALRSAVAGPDPLRNRLQAAGDGASSSHAQQIMENAAELPTIRVRACMVPRTDIAAANVEAGLEGLREVFITSGYSKIPVYQNSLDEVLGYAHHSALFKKPKAVEDILSDILTVPDSMTASQLLVEFSRARKSIALVIDEYGGTAGLVTVEDVMEEIFGDIEDELDEDTETEIQEDAHTWLLSARLEVDYLNSAYELDLPLGEYESLGGLVTAFHQDLPDVGEVVEVGPFSFEIISTEETRIKLIRLRVEVN